MVICSNCFLKSMAYFAVACGQKCCFRMCFGCYEELFKAFAIHFSSHLLFKEVFFCQPDGKSGHLFKSCSM